MKFKFNLSVTMVLSLITVMAQAQIKPPTRLAIVVNVNNPTTTMSAEEIGDLYLHRATHFPNAKEATLIDQPVNSVTYENFYREITHKTPGQIQGYWSRLVFTGKGRPPKQVAGNAEVKKMVSGNQGNLGYVEETALDKTVKPVLLLNK
ncbi:hypothetical protein [Duganella qianjiadongensis]|uniref:Phosphate ABC transporter substrate-binding protein n=1 Tax=Duganella qianjiadongensis TaxID=2692176 RepID=A0ABW9VR19_9BURK|nr:hypothetical protein [Duganella qianjiadongensis]MYM42014.1 hypothetical protein [Duganella qianjiadongensis]